jgi:flagellar M-ring protein FliF
MGALGNVTGFWEGLTGPSRRLIIGAVAIFLVGVVVLMKFSGSDSYATLATPASASDASAITKQLDSLGIRYKLTNGGGTIQVPSSEVDKARIDLAGSGVLDGGAVVGNEIFDKSNLGATDFTNRVNLVRATEGELVRAIQRLDPVQSATVNIAMPQEQLFTEDQQPTTAAVVLTMKLGQQLDPGQVDGIMKLVAGSVPGLKATGVTITDSQGNILKGASDASAGAANERMTIEGAYERSMQSKLDAMLAATLGPGMAVTQVHANLNLDKVTTDSETFPDKTKVVPLQTDTSKEKLDSTGGGSGAATGTSANTPAANTFPATTSGSGTTKYSKATDTTTNGVDRIRSQVEQTPGAVVKQSVAVQVSDKVPSAVQASLPALIQAAVGYDAKRGDIVNVQAVPFATNGTAVTAAAAAEKAAKSGTASAGGGMDIMGLAKTAAALIGLLMLAFFARKSLRGRQSDLEKALPELLKRGPVPVSELPGGQPVRQLEGQRKSPIEAQMEDLAKRKPDDVAQLLRGWLLENR